MRSWKKTPSPAASATRTDDQQLTRYLPEQACEALAREVGLQQRTPRKIHPGAFLRALCGLAFCRHCSLEVLAARLGLEGARPVSKQAVAKRCHAAAVDFLRAALFAGLAAVAQFPHLARAGLFRHFGRVLIQDSTTLALHPRLAAVFPGSRNQSGQVQASAKIQAVYDLRAERFLDFSLSGFTRNDQAAAPDILALVRQGDLVLRDLGYFVLAVFAQLQQRGAFFLSRLRTDVRLLDPQGQPFALLAQLRALGQLDVPLLLGEKERVPIRLVAVPVPPAIAAARRRAAQRNRDRRCRPNRAHLQLLGWEIFVTNVPPTVWTAAQVCQVYGLRWRIEIIFKAWKSHFRMTDLPAGSAEQVQLLLYARLLTVSVHQTGFALLADYFECAYARHLSLLRFSQFCVDHHGQIKALAQMPAGPQRLEQLLLRHCCYDKRKDRLNYPEVLQCLG